jgi:hypothetical protein
MSTKCGCQFTLADRELYSLHSLDRRRDRCLRFSPARSTIAECGKVAGFMDLLDSLEDLLHRRILLMAGLSLSYARLGTRAMLNDGPAENGAEFPEPRRTRLPIKYSFCKNRRDKNVIVVRSRRHRTRIHGSSRNRCKLFSNIVGSRVFRTHQKRWVFS